MQWHKGMPLPYPPSLLVSNFLTGDKTPVSSSSLHLRPATTPTVLTRSPGTVTITPLHKYTSEVTSVSFCTFL